jgi:murein DD-endopeptidase MepM/ murein hydrolase activator NlpD
MKLRVGSRQLILLALLAGGLSGCQPATPDPVLVAAGVSAVQTAAAVQPTAVLAAVQPDAAAAAPTLPPAPTATLPEPAARAADLDPLRFVFPSPGPEPIAAWRPPLYPTPWAPTPYDHFYFARPIGADEINWPLADYRYGGVYFKDEVHTGVDIPARRGTPVLAAAAGKVLWAGMGLMKMQSDPDDPYGNAVSIRHPFGYQGDTLHTIYGHMDTLFVQRGEWVEAGQILGLVGDTGHVTGVHLHFEIRVGHDNYFTSRNPELWIAPPQGWGVLAARITHNNGEPIAREAVRIFALKGSANWEVRTYGSGSVYSDPYYKENMVIGDLPAGEYRVWVNYNNTVYNHRVTIQPGMVTFFAFKGKGGFSDDPPRPPNAAYFPTPILPTASPTPEG